MVYRYVLDNGLTVLLEPVEGVVSISVGLWARAGSRDEDLEQYGFAHFNEHMLFKGTGRHSAKDIAQIVDRVGGHHNAATNREYTCYYINVISDYLELSLELLADMYHDSLFSEEEIEKEKNVILEEIRMYDDTPDELIHDLLMECMFRGHPLGHSVLGSDSTVREAGRDSLVGFYDAHYRNDNCILVIAGRFDTKYALKLVERFFSDGRNGRMQAPGKRENRLERVYQHHVDRDLEQVHLCLGIEGLDKRDEDRWSLYSLSTILGGSMSSRLFQNIRENEGLCYSIYSFHSAYEDSGTFGIYCGSSPDKYERILDLIERECRDILRGGITEQELADSKTFMKGSLALSLESTEVRMGLLARNEMTFGRHFTFDEIAGQIDGVTMDDINRVCRKILGNGRMTHVTIGKLNKSLNKEINLSI